MTISETITGEVAITANDVTIVLSCHEAFELLDWLYDHRETLYQRSQRDEPNWHLDPSRDVGERHLPEPGEEDRLHLAMQARMHKTMEDIGIVPAPARADKISYQQAQAHKLCPYCGDQGVLYSGPERDDADFQAYQCGNEHIFYVDKTS